LDSTTLRDLNYFSLTNNLRLVKYFLACKNSLLKPENTKIGNFTQIVYYSCIFLQFEHRIFIFYIFRDLCVSMRSSAGSEQFFLDKQSEICQIFSSLEEFPARARRTQMSKITHLVHYISILGPFVYDFVIFRILDICVQA